MWPWKRNRLKRDDKLRKKYTPDQVMDMLHDTSVSIMQMENIIHMVYEHPERDFVKLQGAGSIDRALMRMATTLYKSNIRTILESGDWQTMDKWNCDCPEEDF